MWSVETIVNAFKKYQRDQYALFEKGISAYNTAKETTFIQENYAKAENISIDYAILEQSKSIYTLPATFDWNDLGTWGALYDKLDKDPNENAVVNAKTLLENAKGNMIRTPKDKVVVVDGLEDSGDEVKKDFKGLLGSVRKFLSDLLEIRSNTDAAATKESIIADIPFKGHTSWILVCSIFIASIGLNANSTAVVIGAMLISPLMGPILGMGMSLAINDIDTLRRSLKNFTVMVTLSVITAFLFFYLFPLRDESSELLARTKPDIRDVLIAFFGGLALVIARAKKGTIASVIFG
ncbi:rfbM, partial [Symbiodinium sp. KB8]